MSASTTFIPSAANASAMPKPMPLAPPVTTATLPVSSSMVRTLGSVRDCGMTVNRRILLAARPDGLVTDDCLERVTRSRRRASRTARRWSGCWCSRSTRRTGSGCARRTPTCPAVAHRRRRAGSRARRGRREPARRLQRRATWSSGCPAGRSYWTFDARDRRQRRAARDSRSRTCSASTARRASPRTSACSRSDSRSRARPSSCPARPVASARSPASSRRSRTPARRRHRGHRREVPLGRRGPRLRRVHQLQDRGRRRAPA